MDDETRQMVDDFVQTHTATPEEVAEMERALEDTRYLRRIAAASAGSRRGELAFNAYQGVFSPRVVLRLLDRLDAAETEVGRLRRALGEQTEQVRRWRNRAQSLRRRRSKMMRRLGLPVSADDSEAGPCCLGLTPEECADVPGRHCTGMPTAP